MTKVQTFRDIIAWQQAHELALVVYSLSKNFPREELFGLTSQMRRCAVSVPSNIAEDFKRRTTRDAIHFYNIAEGSLGELKYQLLLSRDLHYVTDAQYSPVEVLADCVGKVLHGWIKAQRSS